MRFFAFRKDEVIPDLLPGEQAYSLPMVITSTQVGGGPEYSVQIRDWKAGEAVAVDDFGFKQPPDAEKIDVKDLKGKFGDLPENFVTGDGK